MCIYRGGCCIRKVPPNMQHAIRFESTSNTRAWQLGTWKFQGYIIILFQFLLNRILYSHDPISLRSPIHPSHRTMRATLNHLSIERGQSCCKSHDTIRIWSRKTDPPEKSLPFGEKRDACATFSFAFNAINLKLNGNHFNLL